MLHKAKTLKGYKLHCLDGEIGEVKEFYFDDHYWTVRYMVADPENWLKERLVLISPYALTAVNIEGKYIKINLTKMQIEDSPSLFSDQPVSQQFEETYYGYYGWPMYWIGPYIWGKSQKIERDFEKSKESYIDENKWDPNLRSTHEVSSYHIQATDGEIGHVEDFIIDDETWEIRYLIIKTHDWWYGKKILISPRWIEHISWETWKVFVNLSRDIIKRSPEYNEETLLTREYETGLHQHYNIKGYWVDDSTGKIL
jgi:sporulation protein YlmC with PRC-barrel domain